MPGRLRKLSSVVNRKCSINVGLEFRIDRRRYQSGEGEIEFVIKMTRNTDFCFNQ